MEPMPTPQSILSSDMVDEFISMFLKYQVYFLIQTPLFLLFIFIYFFILNLLIF